MHSISFIEQILQARPCVSYVNVLQVVVAEAAPRYDGHRMARQLADAKVQTTLIADSAVFAMMARANKVSNKAGCVLDLLVCDCCVPSLLCYISLNRYT